MDIHKDIDNFQLSVRNVNTMYMNSQKWLIMDIGDELWISIVQL